MPCYEYLLSHEVMNEIQRATIEFVYKNINHFFKDLYKRILAQLICS